MMIWSDSIETLHILHQVLTLVNLNPELFECTLQVEIKVFLFRHSEIKNLISNRTKKRDIIYVKNEQKKVTTNIEIFIG